MKMKTAFRIIKSVWSALTILLFIVASAVEFPPAQPEGADLLGQDTYMLEQALLRGQGVTNDGEYFYFSGNYFLTKVSWDGKTVVEANHTAIPLSLQKLGCNHIGGISYYDGKIYAAVEDGSDYLHPFIVVYDARTLRFTGTYYALPQELHVDGVPWCAVDAARGRLYTAEWSNAKVLNVFNIEDMSLVGTVPLSQPLDRIQGAEMYGDTLYLSSDKGDAKTVWSLDPLTGEVNIAFTRNIGEDYEAEGMTVSPAEGGFIAHIIDIGPMRVNVRFRHYFVSTSK